MFLKKIKKWLNSNTEFTADDARAGYKKYKKNYETSLKIMQRTYIKELNNEIKKKARKGNQSITTVDTCYDFFTYNFMEEIKEYFEQKGFNVKEEMTYSGVIKSWLIISWE